MRRKRPQVLKEAVPGATRVGVIIDPDEPSATQALKSLPAITRALGLAARVIEVSTPTDFEPAFATATRESLQGLQVNVGILFVSHRAEITVLAASARLPTIYGIREFAMAGRLMSYGTSLPDLYRNKARLVDKILKGSSPASLPIERPTKFELVINLNVAKALGLNVPDKLLVAADEVIE